jgi:hypothetical protein
MKRWLVAITLVLTNGAVATYAQERGTPRPGPTDPRNALLAALGTATLECLGTLGPTQYATETGVLARTFDSCPNGDRTALTQIDELLGVQNSDAGRVDDLAGHYVGTWDAFVANFPGTRIRSCPVWERTQAIEAPTFESVPRNIGRVGKANFRYQVSSTQCGERHRCAVSHAEACAQGFGPDFLVELDPKSGSIVVDPAWWLTRYAYAIDTFNPFKMPGYYHAMSYYGDPPGALYGALQREGEACSQYIDGLHYTDRVLRGIDCGGGWVCMTYCTQKFQ